MVYNRKEKLIGVKFNVETFRFEIEIIKIMLCTLPYMGLTLGESIRKIVLKLTGLYEMEKNKKYLYCAILYIQAYLEFGFDYDVLFDKVINELGYSKEEVFPKDFYKADKVKLNKSQVRSMIRKWKPGNKSTIAEVVQDIITKVKLHQEGIYYYVNSGTKKDIGEMDITSDVYELVINKSECYFHDIRRKKYFTFDD